MTPTQFHDEDLYHYHNTNEPYLGFYILFPGDYQKTASWVQ